MNNCGDVVYCVPKLFVKIREDLRMFFCPLMNTNLTLIIFVRIRGCQTKNATFCDVTSLCYKILRLFLEVNPESFPECLF